MSKRAYVRKECLFCQQEAKLTTLYPRSFQDEDLNAEVFSARRVTEHYHYEMVRCVTCGLVFSRDTLSDNDLSELYSDSVVTFSEYTDVLRRDYWKPLPKFASRFAGRSAIEVGCSSGFFLEELKHQGFSKLIGFELSREAKQRAHVSIRGCIENRVFEGAKTVGDEKFDLLCCFQTLDHLSDPVAFIKSCGEVLRPGGLVYMVTHDVDSLQAKILKDKSPIIDVEHIYLYNQETLPRLFNENGFRVLESGAFQNSYPLKYWATMFPFRPRMKSAVHKMLKWSHLDNFSPAIRAGNIYAIAEYVR